MALLGYFGHADDTQNTVFCLFTPDTPGLNPYSFPYEDSVYFGTRPGKRYNFLPAIVDLTEEKAIEMVRLRRIAETDGREPDPEIVKRIVWEYQNATDGDGVAKVMNDLADQYPIKKSAKAGVPNLPVMADLTQALNVAAADVRATLVLVHPEPRDEALEASLSRLAFEEGIAGRTYIARLTADEWASAKDQGKIKGGSLEAGVMFVAPNTFGLEGEVWAEIPCGTAEGELRTELVAVLERFRTEWRKLDRKSHVKEGLANNISWSEYDPEFGGVVRIEGKSKKLGGKKRGSVPAAAPAVAPAAGAEPCDTPPLVAPTPPGTL
jgi:hypothetical protein